MKKEHFNFYGSCGFFFCNAATNTIAVIVAEEIEMMMTTIMATNMVVF